MVAFLFTTLIFLFFPFSEKISKVIESIKMPGFDLKTRAEIKDSINELRILAKINAKAILQLLQTQGRFSSQEMEQKTQVIYNETLKTLEEIGIPNSEIAEIADKNWHPWVIFDYFQKIRRLINILFPDISQEINSDTFIFKSIDEAKHKLDEYKNYSKDTDNQDLKTCVEDLDYYLNNKKHRSMERWGTLNGG